MGDEKSKLKCVDCGPGLSMGEGEKLLVDGRLVDVIDLETTMEEVRRMKLTKRKDVADELLSRTKAKNGILAEQEKIYRNALMDEYDRRYLTIM
ncbi:MAG: hypothetical protein E4H30_05120 [Methanomassiliicoccus sp.]|nr:MAG: hypothetical protein E4H30_05120 [Methanomassiliicoccus sp.]